MAAISEHTHGRIDKSALRGGDIRASRTSDVRRSRVPLRVLVISACAHIVVAASTAKAQCPSIRGSTFAPPVKIESTYGFAAASHGDWCVVGAIGAFGNTIDSGAVDLLRYDSGQWSRVATLTDNHATPGSRLGWAVDISDDLLIFSNQPTNALDVPTIFVYRKQGLASDSPWVFDGAIQEPSFAPVSLAIMGNRIVAGGLTGIDPFFAGWVAVFEFADGEWNRTAFFRPDGPLRDDFFGSAVGSVRGFILVGASLDDQVATDAGAMYVFEQNDVGWSQHLKVLPPGTRASAYTGADISCFGDRVLVGGSGAGVSRLGMAWLYCGIDGGLELEASISPPHDYSRSGPIAFGGAVDLGEHQMLVGAEVAPGGGAAFLFERVGAHHLLKSVLRDGTLAPNGNARLGASVAIHAEEPVVGATNAYGAPGQPTGVAVGFKTPSDIFAVVTEPLSRSTVVGLPVSFSCEAIGPGQLTFRWRRNGQDLLDDGRISGTATRVLRIAAVVAGDAGQYTLSIVSDQCGALDSSAASLSIAPCFGFVTQPQDVTPIIFGGAVSFSADANSPVPLTFRWHQNGVPLLDGGSISGASTPTLVIHPTTPERLGSYHAEIVGVCGRVSTDAALFSLSPAWCPGDANGDRRVDMIDISTVISEWGRFYVPSSGLGDGDRDGDVDFGDVTMALGNWGASCP